MIKLLLYSYTLINSLIFIQINHPLTMGLMLLIQTILICLISGLMTKTFWFSYILFLIFLGGMLVLFIYVISLASNEMFYLSKKLIFMSMLIFMCLLIINMILDKSLLININNNNEINSISMNKSYMNENSISLNKLYNYPTNMITIMLINYLLLTLIIIVKITNIFYGPIRNMN
uniref:NADH-ubiquinone oxidoreductase chain 6 n=1 Tax=Dialysis sp. KW-2016 TaxID=1812709 RepID=A0A161FY34_9DIPT|nr:NADH dehydrogenase subunit 6 [Dialysis sp. KW-2016]